MKIEKAFNVRVTEGEIEIRMGSAMTSIYIKEQEKAVLYMREVDTIIALLNKGKEELASLISASNDDILKEVNNKLKKDENI